MFKYLNISLKHALLLAAMNNYNDWPYPLWSSAPLCCCLSCPMNGPLVKYCIITGIQICKYGHFIIHNDNILCFKACDMSVFGHLVVTVVAKPLTHSVLVHSTHTALIDITHTVLCHKAGVRSKPKCTTQHSRFEKITSLLKFALVQNHRQVQVQKTGDGQKHKGISPKGYPGKSVFR